MIGILNGVVDDVDNIKVSPLSRAYTFGDAVYEVIPYAYGFVLLIVILIDYLTVANKCTYPQAKK